MRVDSPRKDVMEVPVEIAVTGRNVAVSSSYRSYVADRLATLGRFNRHIVRYDVELTHEQNPRQSKSSRCIAITATGSGPTVRAVAHGADSHSVLDAAVGKLEAQLRRDHDRFQVHHYRRQRIATEYPAEGRPS